MTASGSLILVHLVEKQAVGRFERTRDQWPLHITLVPWFRVADERVLRGEFAAAAKAAAAFKVSVGKLVSFGAYREVAVNLIQDPSEIGSLHRKLLAALRRLSAGPHDARYIGDDYQAHITRHLAAGRWRDEGAREDFSDFHMVRLLDGNICEVAERFVLSGGR